ncbi:LysR substrate-binding domain-containing protein [Leeia sp.]|uniref:LysR substrate-binding domain-containing protein n=1 Tax=Leeia sp. TaxID=2884678 RepID=UPI0035B18C38
MKLPVHLNALRAFEASARHQSFAGAAAELNVTPAAVGQLVRTLEAWLGTPLFHRSSSGRQRLIVSDSAQRALPDIRAGFDRLSLGLDLLKAQTASGVLTVTVSPAFASKWLLPRIDRFQAQYPDTDVRLDTSLKPIDFITHGIDIGVRYGTGHWPGLTAEKLLDEDLFPVASPRLLERHGSIATLLANESLLHDLSMDGHADFPGWEGWLQHAGWSGLPVRRGLQINNSAAVLQAAMDGHGIALARSVMVKDDLATGALVRLSPDLTLPSPLAYYVVYRPDCATQPKLTRFRDWLLQEAA